VPDSHTCSYLLARKMSSLNGLYYVGRIGEVCVVCQPFMAQYADDRRSSHLHSAKWGETFFLEKEGSIRSLEQSNMARALQHLWC
jgi:hypothetical protein